MLVMELIMELTIRESLEGVYSHNGEHLRGRGVELKESIRNMVLEKEENGNRNQNSNDDSG